MIIKILFFLFLPGLVFAEVQSGMGGVANNLMTPTTLATDFIHAGCYVLGTAFIFASIVKYIEHKRSPTMVTLGTVVFLLIGGLLLIAIPVFTS